MKNARRALHLMLIMIFLAGQIFYAQPASAQEELHVFPAPRPVSLVDCVWFAVYNSFEVKLARLDLYIAETGLMYSQAVYDTFLYGGASYIEDKRQQLSVFAPDDSQTNNYSAGVTKTLPTGTELTAELSDEREWTNTIFVSKNPAHNAELLLQFKQPVLKNTFGFVDRTNVSVTKLAIKNADLEMRDRIEALIADVEKAYWDLVFAKRRLEIFDGILEKARNLHETNRKNFDMGLIEKVDFVASEANLSQAEAEVLVVKNNYRRAEENLKLIMNQNAKNRITSAERFNGRYLDRDLPGCLKEAFEKRRDYKIRKRDIKINGLELSMKDNERWPEVDLTGSMSMNGLEGKFEKAMGKTTVVDNVYYYAGIEVSFPFENREAESEYLKAKYEKQSALVKFKQVERRIITEVGNAFRAVIAYENSIGFIKKAAVLESEKLKEEEKRYKYGRSNTKRIIDYQRDLLFAELEEARYLLNHMIAKVDLDRSMNIILGKYEDIL